MTEGSSHTTFEIENVNVEIFFAYFDFSTFYKSLPNIVEQN